MPQRTKHRQLNHVTLNKDLFMRKMLCFFLFSFLFHPIFLHGQKLYDQRWRKIDTLMKSKGLSKSALKEVDQVYQIAKKEHNEVQAIKALIYRMHLNETLEENSIQKNVHDLKIEISKATGPSLSILRSLLASLYWKYFQENRWNLYDRTRSNQISKEDPAAWAIADFHKNISALYVESISDATLLKKISLSGFDPIILKGNARFLRPTLFDLLAHRALDYYRTDEMDLIKPSYAFAIKDSQAFSEANIFISHHFLTNDTGSLHYRAILLYQDLLRFHIHDLIPDALIDVDIDRIEYVNDFGEMENKDVLYFDALKAITNQYTDNPIAAKAWYLQASRFENLAHTYTNLVDTSNRYAYITAKSICEKVLKQKDSSEGKSGCMQIMDNILRKDLQLQIEKVNIPEKPSRVLVSYKNINEVNFRLIKYSRKLRDELNSSRDIGLFWKKLVLLGSIRTFIQQIPDPQDFQIHRAEIKLDGLEPGEYALIASEKSDFSLEKNPLSFQSFYVSNIAYIQNDSDYFVLNRETGQPLAGTDVQLWYSYYDSRSDKLIERKGENFNTDKHGFFHIVPSKKKSNERMRFEFTSREDKLTLENEYTDSYYRWNGTSIQEDSKMNEKEYEEKNMKTFFFTDRSIYRPGQTVYFKGIALTKDYRTKNSKVLTQLKTIVRIYDANEQLVDSLEVLTNEFGSYHGQFKLPFGKLTGLYKIIDRVVEGEQSFSVEEYKRPKFYLAYDKLKDSYRLNDRIQVKGWAKAYAGYAIAGATVKYSITRKVKFPYPWLWLRWQTPPITRQVIQQGELRTATDGSYLIEFPAIPDGSVKKEISPIFEFEMVADVTDLNGETRTAQTSVQVGYQSLVLVLGMGPIYMKKGSDTISIYATNLSGEWVPSAIHISIYPLESPGRLIRKRYWKEPDQFVMTKQEYVGYFPHDEYQNEANKDSWTRLNKVFDVTDSAKENSAIKLNDIAWSPGWYLIDVETKDQYGVQVKNRQYVECIDPNSNKLSYPIYFWSDFKSTPVEPGNFANSTIASGADSVFLIRQLASKKTKYDYFSLNNGKKAISISINETDRGGIGETYAFVKDNRMYTGSNTIFVPWTNKELGVTYASFRDKTLPGSVERWKIRIAGNKKEKVVGELLTAMYDASLDQFQGMSWQIPAIFPIRNMNSFWQGSNNFGMVWSYQKPIEDNRSKYFILRYDQLFSANSGAHMAIPIMLRGLASPSNGKVAESSLVDIDITAAKSNAPIEDSSRNFTNGEVKRNNQMDNSNIQIRKNFNETAFFLPDLRTDDSGNVEFSFTMPEALTRWKWMSLAHTKDLAFGYKEATIITQKKLMVQPNPPRFLRSGDHIEFPVKIVNMTDSEMTGQTQLQLIDPATNQPIDGWFSNRQPNQYFTAGPMESTTIYFPIDVPFEYNKVLDYRIEARAGSISNAQAATQISDGEEAMLPVLSNRMLVMESLPLNMPSGGTKDFKFVKLIKTAESESLSPYALTIEYTTNPAWYAVQSLPWLMEYPYECAEQVFNRFYANMLGSSIINASPVIRNIFEQWKKDSAGLMSNLQKNQELKSVLLQETPWVLEAKNEEQQHRNLALLMDMVRMHDELESALSKLESMQSEGGGFPWFKQGPDDRYITQYILTGIGHLKKLGAIPPEMNARINQILQRAMVWVDKKVQEDYDAGIKKKNKTNTEIQLGQIQIQWLYMRSFFPEFPIRAAIARAYAFYSEKAAKQWLQESRFMQGMIAIFLNRKGDQQIAKQILASLKDNAIYNEELGMYWKDMKIGYYWYQSPIETVSLLIEAYGEIDKDSKSVNAMKTWLLTQKQTQNWGTTRATADACYALLLQGTDWLKNTPSLKIKLGNMEIPSKANNNATGLGYFKESILPPFIKPEMGNI